jgi:predicted enzyme related to lactoylglutathione lyase
MTAPLPGTIGWIDLTVNDATRVRDFYAAVAGWTPSPVAMGDYNDYVMSTPDGTPITGVCHARGSNAGLPPQWLMYITVVDLDAALAEVEQRGGARIGEIRTMGAARYTVIQDPAGAVAALFQPAP